MDAGAAGCQRHPDAAGVGAGARHAVLSRCAAPRRRGRRSVIRAGAQSAVQHGTDRCRAGPRHRRRVVCPEIERAMSGSPEAIARRIAADSENAVAPPEGFTRFGAGRGTGLRLGELWAYRELLYFLVWRDIKVRYK